MFPDNPELVEKLWKKGADQMGTAEVAANVFKQPNVEIFIKDLFEKIQQSLDEDYNTGYCKSILDKIKKNPEFTKYENIVCQITIPIIKKLRADDNFGSFPEDRVPLSHMKERAEALSADNMAKAKQIIKMLKSDEKLDEKAKAQQKKAEEKQEKEGSFWHDVDTPYGCFRISACPTKGTSKAPDKIVAKVFFVFKSVMQKVGSFFGYSRSWMYPPKEFDQVSLLFKAALSDGIRVFVSLNETGESSTRKVSDFWKSRVLDAVNIPGWKLKNLGETELASEEKGPKDFNKPRVVERTIEATNLETGKKTILTHLHSDGQRDQSPIRSTRLFNVLQNRIYALTKDDLQRRVWFNCIGGKGRSASAAVGQCALRHVHQQAQDKTPLEKIEVNNSELISLFRRYRPGAVGQASHIVGLHEWLGTVYEELKAQ
jgi:hypothetical protein